MKKDQTVETVVETQEDASKEVKVETHQEKIQRVFKDENMSKSKKMVELYNMGLQIKDIATVMAVRYNFVYNVISNHCRMNGLTLELTKKDGKKDEIIKMFLDGKSNKDISITLKTNYNYVFNVLKQYKSEHPELNNNKEKAAE